MKNKTTKYAINGAIIFGIGNALLNALIQLNEMNDDPNKEFDWERLFKAGGKGALAGGAGGLVVGGIMDYRNGNERPLNTSAILGTLMSDMMLDKNDPTYMKLSRKAERIVNMIKSHYKNSLGGPILRIGSTEEGTALSSDFDIDISVPFSPYSFSSTGVMIEDLYNFLDEYYQDYDLIKIRQQRKSIGLIFDIDGERFKVDIVPYKLSKNSDNKTTGYLYVKADSIFEKDSYTKTDISALKSINLTPIQQKLLVGFKTWKMNYSIPISSHLLRLLILDSYEYNKGRIPRDFTKKTLMVVQHIKNNITHRRIVSVENTNNILTDMSDSDKRSIQDACKQVLDDYEYQPNSIIKYFE